MRWLPLAAATLAAGCSYVGLDFSRPLSPNEVALEQQVRGLYTEMQAAFAAGNPQEVVDLFSPSITHPMTQGQIRDWATAFFAKHGRANLRILSFSFDKLSFARPVVTFKYSIETPDGKGNLAGVETDTLVQRDGRWYIASWDKDQ